MGQGVEVIRRSDRRQPAQTTPGMLREEAFDNDGTWVGTVRTEPGVETGWHHHGAYTSYIYVVSGTARMEWGAGGAERVDCEAGDVIHVAPGVIHREITTGTMPSEAVLFRVGSGQVTFNTEGPDDSGDSGE
jgi:uncharacterized RmlC-like cupin family protein